MSVESCMLALRKNLAEKGIEHDEEFYTSVRKTLDEQFSAKGLTIEEAKTRANEKLVKAFETFAEKQKYGSQLSLLRATNAAKNVFQTVKVSGKRLSETILDEIHGWKNGQGTDAKRQGFIAEILNASGLTADEVRFGITSDLTLNKELAQAIRALTRGEQYTGDATIKRIAEKMWRANEVSLSKKMSLDPTVTKNKNYMYRQVHNGEKILANEEGWLNYMVEYASDTVEGASPEQLREYFKSVKGNLTTPYLYAGSPNRAAIMEAERKIVFNSAEAEAVYATRFGYGSVMENWVASVDHSARELALIDKFGGSVTQFKEFFTKQLQESSKYISEEDLAVLNSGKFKRAFDKAFDVAEGGYSFNPTSATWIEKRARQVAQLAFITKGGFSGIRAFSDIFISAAGAAADATGKSYLEVMPKVFMETLSQFTSTADRARAASKIGLFSSVLYGETKGALKELNGGVLGNMSQFVGKYSGLRRISDATRVAMGTIVSDIMAEDAQRGFGNLSKKVQESYLRGGFAKEEFDLLAKGIDEAKAGGYSVKGFSMSTISKLDPNEFKALAVKAGMPVNERSLLLAKQDFMTKVSGYLNHLADIGSSTPTEKQAAFMASDSTLFKLFFTMRSSSITAFNNYWDIAARKGGVQTAAQMAVFGSAAYYGTQVMVDVLNGKTPSSLESKETYLKALAGSGIGGLYMDGISGSLFKDRSVTGSTLLGAFMGPSLSPLADLGASVANRMSARSATSVGNANRKIFQNSLNFIPLPQNLPVLSLATQYVKQSVFEELDHGYLHDLDVNLKKVNQARWFK